MIPQHIFFCASASDDTELNRVNGIAFALLTSIIIIIIIISTAYNSLKRLGSGWIVKSPRDGERERERRASQATNELSLCEVSVCMPNSKYFIWKMYEFRLIVSTCCVHSALGVWERIRWCAGTGIVNVWCWYFYVSHLLAVCIWCFIELNTHDYKFAVGSTFNSIDAQFLVAIQSANSLGKFARKHTHTAQAQNLNER